MTLKLLLLQARQATDPARHEERVSFAKRLGAPLSAIVAHDLLQGPPSLEKVRAHRAMLIGGSGEFDVSKRNLPHFDATLQRLREIVDLGLPMFASCFGFQLLVQALGGEIVNDPETAEIGTFPIHLTEEAKKDELFSILPDTFLAQLGHKERAESMPPGVITLAYSDKVAHEAMRIPGKPIWATQFHPELDLEDHLVRFRRYLHIYAHLFSEEQIEAMLASFKPSPEAEKLLPRFMAIVCAPHEVAVCWD
ncbi:MAG TPA: type 1 glutamine amidotransferase [Anaerolineae bacterium]|nr:type 1 glutamine amidotransferase [Caldilineae bacterium]HID34925.1 type 1 glutamine amidotransferase [Anaerolineae bacterium]HIQ11589.1 type 1 glutamine amidotransferase [Caldilineales bacterium]